MIRKRNLSPELISWIQGMGAIGPGIGDVFFLVPPNTATAQFKSWLWTNGVNDDNYSSDFATLYARMKTGRNDTMVVLPGSYTLSAVSALNKSYTHIIGATAPNQVNSRARLVATVAGTPLVTYSGNGSIYKNLMWSQDGTHASSYAVNGYVTGARNYFENVTWRNLGAASIAGTAMRNLKLGTGDAENTFVRCTLGADTVDYGSGTMSCLEYVTGAQSARNTFRECNFLSGGAALGTFILASGAQCINSFQMFERCFFFNNTISDLDAMTQAFNIAATAGGFFFLMDSLVFGAACYETTDSGCLYGRHAYAAATSDLAVALTY